MVSKWGLSFRLTFFNNGRFFNPFVEVIPQLLTLIPDSFLKPETWLKSERPLQFLMPRSSKLSRPEIPDKFFNSGLSVINNVFKFLNLDKSDIVEILVFLTVSFSRLLNPETDKREVML